VGKVKKQEWKKWIKSRSAIFCDGCQYGIILNYLAKALCLAKIERKKLVAVSGIGCAGWITDLYLHANTVHTTHGRPIPLATGIKLANPQLDVIVVSGDGDLATIGTNHLVHVARRNLDITVICANNFVYGMTGGQTGATTPQSAITSTNKQGNPHKALDLIHLALACGCSFAARYPALFIKAPQKIPTVISRALKYKGFSFVEIIAPCATHFNKKNSIISTPELLVWLEKNKMPYGIFNDSISYLKEVAKCAWKY
jgi:2-oxoglutarate ferredoxin oxidoreductase subunit beta